MKEGGSVNTNSGIERIKSGTQPPARMAGDTTVAMATKTMTVNLDVPRWIAIWKILIGRYWGCSSTSPMVIGWNNCSNMRGFASAWSDEEYEFMSSARKTWPKGCTASSTTTSNGSYIYYDLKPTSKGGMTFGLYTDARCMEEYDGSISLQTVLGNILLEGGSHDSNDKNNYDTSDYTLAQSLATWDSIFDAWKICQPCVAYDLNNVGYNTGAWEAKGARTKKKLTDDDQPNSAGTVYERDAQPPPRTHHNI
jgi:hypothetical protein